MNPSGIEVAEYVGLGLSSVTGQTVVEIAMVFVVTEPTGQFVTVGGHLVIVSMEVVYTVEVV